LAYPSINYSSTFFNTTEWEIAKAIVDEVSILFDADKTIEINKLISF
jgi:hypothetical protein